MSKKNKKKLKKLLRAKALEQAKSAINSNNNVLPSTAPKESEDIKNNITDTDIELKRVKSEVIKILITIGVIFIVITAVYLINQKTDWVLQSGEYLTKLFNIKL